MSPPSRALRWCPELRAVDLGYGRGSFHGHSREAGAVDLTLQDAMSPSFGSKCGDHELFFIEILFTYSVLVSGVQQGDSDIYVYMYIFQVLFHYRLLRY